MFTPGQPKKHPMESMDPGMDEAPPDEGQDMAQDPKMEAIQELIKYLQQSEGNAVKSKLAPPPPPPGAAPAVGAAGDGGQDEMSPEMIDALKKMMG